MKSLLFIGIFISAMSYAQTNVIAAKSHANMDLVEMNDPDNFGEYILPKKVESVTFVYPDCIVEKYTTGWYQEILEHDTICQHPFLQESSFHIDRIKAMYPEETIFKNFDKAEKENKKALKKQQKIQKKKEKNSSVLIIFLLGTGGFLVFLFTPNTAKSNA
jgi:hypothetical protein